MSSDTAADRKRDFLRKLLVEKDYADVFFQDFTSPGRFDDLQAVLKVFDSNTKAFLTLFDQLRSRRPTGTRVPKSDIRQLLSWRVLFDAIQHEQPPKGSPDVGSHLEGNIIHEDVFRQLISWREMQWNAERLRELNDTDIEFLLRLGKCICTFQSSLMLLGEFEQIIRMREQLKSLPFFADRNVDVILSLIS